MLARTSLTGVEGYYYEGRGRQLISILQMSARTSLTGVEGRGRQLISKKLPPQLVVRVPTVHVLLMPKLAVKFSLFSIRMKLTALVMSLIVKSPDI